jgi:predicted alpha/beta-hydrolase family hydrolase
VGNCRRAHPFDGHQAHCDGATRAAGLLNCHCFHLTTAGDRIGRQRFPIMLSQRSDSNTTPPTLGFVVSVFLMASAFNEDRIADSFATIGT